MFAVDGEKLHHCAPSRQLSIQFSDTFAVLLLYERFLATTHAEKNELTTTRHVGAAGL